MDDDFQTEAHKLIDQFLMRGYPQDVLDQAFAKGYKKNRNEPIKCKHKKQKTLSYVFNTTCLQLDRRYVML